MAKSSIVGDVVNFRGSVYGPFNEMGVVNPMKQKLIGNPDHGGKWMIDCFDGERLP